MAKDIKNDKPSSARRNLLNWLWVTLGGVALLEFSWLVFSFLRPGKKSPGSNFQERVIVVGHTDRFARGTVTAFPRGRFYLARLEDGAFLAISRACTHLGCTVPWDEKEAKFICPCHASTFDITGAVILSPAPRALDIYPIVIENNIVTVDVGKPIKRNTFNKKQLTYPSGSPDTQAETKPAAKPDAKMGNS